jgi:soluble cytochrome b562
MYELSEEEEEEIISDTEFHKNFDLFMERLAKALRDAAGGTVDESKKSDA